MEKYAVKLDTGRIRFKNSDGEQGICHPMFLVSGGEKDKKLDCFLRKNICCATGITK